MNKVINYKQAVNCIKSGQSIMVGGFGDTGYPFETIREIGKSDLEHLIFIGNDGGRKDDPKGKLYTSGKVDKLIITYCGLNPDVSKMFTDGEIDIEFVPQGSFIERIRCGGYGLGGVLTPTGLGTLAEEGKQVIEVDGKLYILEKPIRADVAIIKGAKADTFGNIVFRYSAKNYNPFMAMAADTVIAEVDELVNLGEIPKNEIMLSGIFIDYIVENRGED